MTSTDNADAADMQHCASCGDRWYHQIEEMWRCESVWYCGIKCQKDHRPKHKRACKKRVTELRDEILLRQPESSNLGDCPICFLPLPLDDIDMKRSKYSMTTCCGKVICLGCYFDAARYDQFLCPFCCKTTIKTTKEETERDVMKRVQANDPGALREMGLKCNIERDYHNAFRYWSKAAELGDADAHFSLSVMYEKGKGVEKDEERAIFHAEEAAIAGHPISRINLAILENNYNRFDRAVKHVIIAANLGSDYAIKVLKGSSGVSKDDFAAALRSHQAAVDATKSPQRDMGEKLIRRRL